jgi:PAS domain S-box-containing protein
MRSLFGFGADDPLRFDDLLARVHADDRARILPNVERAQAAGLPFEGEFRIVLPNGTERWVLAKGRTVGDPRGSDPRRMGVMLDITERKRAEERFRLAVEASPNAIVMVDWHGEILLVNPSTQNLFGYSREECGQSVEILVRAVSCRTSQHRAAFFGAPQARRRWARVRSYCRRKTVRSFQLKSTESHPDGGRRLVLTYRGHYRAEGWNWNFSDNARNWRMCAGLYRWRTDYVCGSRTEPAARRDP